MVADRSCNLLTAAGDRYQKVQEVLLQHQLKSGNVDQHVGLSELVQAENEAMQLWDAAYDYYTEAWESFDTISTAYLEEHKEDPK